MDQRLLVLLECLFQENMTAEMLSEKIQMSTKTVRKLIKTWNESYEEYGIKIHSKHGQGYFLHDTDKNKVPVMIKKIKDQDREGKIPVTPRDRTYFIINQLLENETYKKIDELSDELFISRKTISSDLKAVSKYLFKYNLRIVSKPNYGIMVMGQEFDKRLCIAHLWEQNKDVFQMRESIILEIGKIAENVFEEEKFSMNMVSAHNMRMYLYIAMERIKAGHIVSADSIQYDEFLNSKEYRIAAILGKRLKDYYGIQFSEEELIYITIHLSGKKTYMYAETDEYDNKVISQEAADLASDMIQAVHDGFNMDFMGDIELRMNLALHVVPLLVRIRYNLEMRNPLLRQTKEKYPLAYAMGLQASTVLDLYGRGKLQEDEIGYIALAFALAMERMSMEQPRKNILIVCVSGKGSAKLLEYKYRREFGAYVNRIITCEENRLNLVDFSEIDYVFTTVPIHIRVPVPIQEVSSFLELDDIVKIKKQLQEDGGNVPVMAYFDERLFFNHLEFDNQNSLMDYLCSKVIQERNVDPAFRKLVEKREKAAKTSFGNLVAIPHPYRAVSEGTFVCVGILDKPIIWEDTYVQVVFLVSISKKRNKDLQHFYRMIAKLAMNREKINILLQNQTYGQMLELFEQI